MRFNIPIQLTVEAKNERAAEQQVIRYLRAADIETASENGILDWEFFEFLLEGEDIGCGNLLGCRDNN